MGSSVNQTLNSHFLSFNDAWKSILSKNLRDSPRPLFLFEEATVPAASIWTGARLWVDEFRRRDLKAGDIIHLSLPPSPAFVQIIVAAIWHKVTLVITSHESPEETFQTIFEQFPLRGSISFSSSIPGWSSNYLSGPAEFNSLLPDGNNSKNHPDIRFFLKTSGTTGSPGWYGLSDRNILRVIESHQKKLQPVKKAVSYLPWDHCFGLVMGLLNYLTSNTVVVRDPESGQNPKCLGDLFRNHKPTFFNAVPKTIRKLAHSYSPEILLNLDDGIVGGAPIRKEHASILNETSMRVGYGQTEASPGICLGRRGKWEPRILGRPVGCMAKITNSELEFFGANAHEASLENRSIERHSCPRWSATGDLVREHNGTYYYLGRSDYRVQVENGKSVHIPTIEKKIRESDKSIKQLFITNEIHSHKSDFTIFVKSSDHSSSSEYDLKQKIENYGLTVSNVEKIDDIEPVINSSGNLNREETNKLLAQNLS